MIFPLAALGLGSLKALLLLAAAAAVTALLRRRPARLRVIVLSGCLAGSLLIPAVTPLLPALEVPVLPTSSPRQAVDTQVPLPASAPLSVPQPSLVSRSVSTTAPPPADSSSGSIAWSGWLAAVWAVGTCAALSHLFLGLYRVRRSLRRATPIVDPRWRSDLRWAAGQVGLRRAVRLVATTEIDIPATAGASRPTVLMPQAATEWNLERRRAVLLHELVHIRRLDWPVRLLARVARAVYWFNPLAWWAVQRLDLEQELACDEEVVALGTRPSAYACHLLGIARAVRRNPAPVLSGLEMARACHLEERIMNILETTNPRTLGARVLAPAVITMVTLIPALAAVAPISSDPPPAQRSELADVLQEIQAVEERMAPHLARIEAVELDLAPELEAIAEVEIELDEEALAAIEAEMEPYLARMEAIELDMAPIHDEMASVEARLRDLELHIDDGTLAEIERQIRDQLEPLHEELERLHASLGPQHEQLEAIHREMEPMHQKLKELHRQIEPQHEELERLHAAMAPYHEQLDAIHREMQPLHEELELLGRRLERAVAAEVEGELRRRLGAVTGPQAPFDEAADRLLDGARTEVDDGTVRIRMSETEAQEILTDLLAPYRIGGAQAFDEAVTAAAEAVANLDITVR